MHDANEAMKAEVESMANVVEEYAEVDRVNLALKTRILKLEEEQKSKERDVEQLRKAVDVKSDEIEKWKGMFNQADYKLRLRNWLEEDMNEENK